MINKNKRDTGLMIVAVGMIVIGIIGLFLDTVIGGTILFVGIGMLLMGYLSKV